MHLLRSKKTLIIATTLFSLVFSGNCLARESRFAVSAEKSINKDYAVGANIDYRFLDQESFFKLYEVSLKKYFKNDLSVQLTHRFYYLHRQSNPDWKLGNMSHIRVAKTVKTDIIDYGFRVAHEYFFGNIQGNQHRSRLLLSIRPHKKFHSFKPFISNEIFYRHKQGRFVRNWLSTGVEYYHGKHARYFINHIYEYNENPNDTLFWVHDHGVLAGAAFKF